MIRSLAVLAVLALSSPAAADPAIRWLTENADGSVSGISPALDVEVSKWLHRLEDATRHPGDVDPHAGCVHGLMTNLVVSFKCMRARDVFDPTDDNAANVAQLVVDGKLVDIKVEDVIGPMERSAGEVMKLRGTQPVDGKACGVPSTWVLLSLSRQGMEIIGQFANHGCVIAWKDALPVMLPGTPVMRVVKALLAGELGKDPPPRTRQVFPPPLAITSGTPAIHALWAPPADPRGFDPAAIPHMIAATSMLTAEINHRYRTELGLFATLAAAPSPEDADPVVCPVGIATNVLVSWMCRRRVDHYTWERPVGTYLIEDGKLRPITTADIFSPRKDLDAQIAALPAVGDQGFAHCAITRDIWFVEEAGLRGFEGDSDEGCLIAWPLVRALLKPGSVVERIARASYLPDGPDAPRETTAAWATDPRFVAEGADAVRDRYTNLVWAAHDNGADLDADAAAAYAKAYRGGGHDDWRLPTEDELEMLSEPAMSHREPKDCTGGKSAYTLTPLIHVSCGLAWSSTVAQGRKVASAVGMGFISGNPRVSARTEKKNYRALVVRKS